MGLLLGVVQAEVPPPPAEEVAYLTEVLAQRKAQIAAHAQAQAARDGRQGAKVSAWESRLAVPMGYMFVGCF